MAERVSSAGAESEWSGAARSDQDSLTGEALLAFAAEDEPSTESEPQRGSDPSSFQKWWRKPAAGTRSRLFSSLSKNHRIRTKYALPLIAATALLVAAASLSAGAYYLRSKSVPRQIVTTGTAVIDSRPQGLDVLVDSQPRGRTPLKLALPFGSHNVQVQQGADSRLIPIIVESGTTTAQFIDFGPPVVPPRTGRLEVFTEPSGSTVSVDGVSVGTTPLTLPAAVGEHKVVVGSGDAAIRRTVTILPGATASVVASLGQPTAAGGWIKFKAPFEMQVLEGGQLIGTTSSDRVMVPAGSHKLDLVNTSLDFRTTVAIQVSPGGTTNSVIAIPNGLLSANALPWAEVEVDGRALGTTPLANVSLPIGLHEIVWKHPQFGERRRTIVLTAATPLRVGVDFSQ
jgi:hypothetical protein